MSKYLALGMLSLFLFVAGCAAFGIGGDDNDARNVEFYTGETTNYDVEVRITEIDGECSERRITLERRPGLHTGNVVYHVEAFDQYCTDEIDDLRFRYPEDARRVDQGRLVEDIWHAYAEAVPIEEQMR